jgi:hypothetical protein
VVVIPDASFASHSGEIVELAADPRAGKTLLRQPATNGPITIAEGVMYAAIRQAKAKSGMADQLASRIKDVIPIISSVQGFMGYYVVYAPDDTVTAISIFNNFAGAEESNRRALAWIEENLGPLLVGPATATAGPVIVHCLP